MAETTNTAAKKIATATVYLDGISDKLIRERKGVSKAGKPYDFISVSLSGVSQSDTGWGNFILGKYDKVLDARNKNGQLLEGRKNVALNSSDSWKYRVSIKKGDGYQNIEMTAKEIKALYDKNREEYLASQQAEGSSDGSAAQVTETPESSDDEFMDVPDEIPGVLFS